MFDYRRSVWQNPKQPVTGPAINWSRIDTVVMHYTGTPSCRRSRPARSRRPRRTPMSDVRTATIRTTVPFTWAATDTIQISGRYEAA